MSKEVVVTGLGIVTRDAFGAASFGEWLESGGGLPSAPGTFDVDRFRAKGAYMVDPQAARAALRQMMAKPSLDLQSEAVSPIEPSLDCAAYGLLATLEAIDAAKLNANDRHHAGLSLATTSGGAMDSFAAALLDGSTPNEAIVRDMRPASAAAIISESVSLGGPFANFSCACISSAMAIAYAFERIQAGDAPLMVAGGCDQAREADYAGFNALRAMDRESCRPFDVGRHGMVMGDGSAVLILEEAGHAAARGAVSLAKLVGIGLATDAHHITAPQPDGLTRAMLQALAQASIDIGEIGYVNCHGTGTPANDEAEIEALSAVFDDPDERPVISSTKGATGHLLGTAAALEAAATVLALQARAVPPMRSTRSRMASGFPMPGVDRPLPLEKGMAMSNSLGFGGLNISLIFAEARGEVARNSPRHAERRMS